MAEGRRNALVSIEKSEQSTNDLDMHPRLSPLLLLNITFCLWTVVSTLLSKNVYKKLPLLKWRWLPIILRTPSYLTTKL